MNELEYILKKYELDPTAKLPIEFRLSRHGGLTKLFHELGYKIGAEIGVEQGKFSYEICRDNPGVKLFCVDPWKAYTRYEDQVSQAKLDGFYQEAIQRLEPYNCTFLRLPSMEAVQAFEDNALDFAFIDGNHAFEFVVNDIIYWSRKVRPGGIVSGHDYRGKGKENPPLPFHVIQAVTAYTSAMEIVPWFVIKSDKCPSWLFVKGETNE